MNPTEPDFQEIIKHLNLKTSKRFTVTEPHRRLIRARFKEGYKIKDFRQAIDNQCRQWENDPKMSPYLRPQTLFSRNFDSYVNNNAPQEKLEPLDAKPIKRQPDNTPDTPEQKTARKEFLTAMKNGDMKGMTEASAKSERLTKKEEE